MKVREIATAAETLEEEATDARAIVDEFLESQDEFLEGQPVLDVEVDPSAPTIEDAVPVEEEALVTCMVNAELIHEDMRRTVEDMERALAVVTAAR